MTREEAKKYLEVIQAYVNGCMVEYRLKGITDNVWEVATDPEFNFSKYEYRVNSASIEYRPFKNAKECLLEMSKHPNCGFVRNYEADDRFDRYDIIISVNDYGIYVCDEDIDFKDALTSCPFTDGTPFGIKK